MCNQSCNVTAAADTRAQHRAMGNKTMDGVVMVYCTVFQQQYDVEETKEKRRDIVQHIHFNNKPASRYQQGATSPTTRQNISQ